MPLQPYDYPNNKGPQCYWCGKIYTPTKERYEEKKQPRRKNKKWTTNCECFGQDHPEFEIERPIVKRHHYLRTRLKNVEQSLNDSYWTNY